MTRFSISVPVGAYHPLLPTCLESLARQGEGVEVSLLDASGDKRVFDLAEKFASLFAYRRHGPDEGQSAAIIEGWMNTAGEILGWLNADDFLFPGSIRKARAVFTTDARTDVVAGHSAICDEEGRMTGYHWAVEAPGDNLRAGCVISQPSCFFRRAAYEKAGGLDAALHYTMDWDLWLRLLESGAKFHFIDDVLSVVYWGEGTKTLGMKPRRRAELMRLIDLYTPSHLKFRARRGFHLRAMLDEMRPQAFSRFIEARLRRRVPTVFGLGPRGALSSEAEIIWTHYDAAPKSVLSIETEGDVSFRASLPLAKAEAGESGLILTFAAPVASGEIARITLNSRGRARLIRCGWK